MRALTGSGLGLRRALFEELKEFEPQPMGPHFLEIAPENWLHARGKEARCLAYFTERYPLAAHGLCLNLGGTKPLDVNFILQIKKFLRQYNITFYSDHLTYCADEGYLYELFPLPFTQETLLRVASRIKQIQDILEQPIAIENASYYCVMASHLTEIEFIKGIIQESGCHLMLDINNVYVNSINHRYDPFAFIEQVDPASITYLHIAGHHQELPDLIIDTHGDSVASNVWKLLEFTYQKTGVLPTLLERDENIPPLQDLLPELARIHQIQQTINKPPAPLTKTNCKKSKKALLLDVNPSITDNLLTQLVRNPQSPLLQQTLPERAQLYADFVYDNFNEILKTCFVILHSVIPTLLWEKLLRDFIKHPFCQDPLFTGVSEAFVHYLKTIEPPKDLPFLHELAHYEWVELKLAIAAGEYPFTSRPSTPDFLKTAPQISPFAVLLHYQYPVQRIHLDFLPETPEPVFLIAYRNREDTVNFLEINLVTARLFELLDTHPGLTGEKAAHFIIQEMQHSNPEAVLQGAESLLRQFHELDIISYS